MNYDQISEGHTYAGLRGVRRRVTSIAPDQPWFSVPSSKRRNCTYMTTNKDGTEREYTIRLDMFAKWATCEVPSDYPGSNGRCVAEKLSVAIGAVAPCDCGVCMEVRR